MLSLLAFPVGFGWLMITMPAIDNLNQCFTTSLFKIHLCSTSTGYTRLEHISDVARHAILLSEDAAFYVHNGLDWHEIKVSFMENLKEGRYKRGASTITQQLIKNVYLSDEKTLLRKVREAYLALALEKKYSKSLILEKYLNVIEFAPRIYGIKQASLYLFNKLPSELHVLESCFLAFLLPNPREHIKNFERSELSDYALERLEILLTRLHRFKRISDDEYNYARQRIPDFPWNTYAFTTENFTSELENEDDESEDSLPN